MPLNVPNLLTWLRIMMIPLVIGVFYVPDVWLSSWHRNLIATAVFALLIRRRIAVEEHALRTAPRSAGASK